jgi:hypothetical protein
VRLARDSHFVRVGNFAHHFPRFVRRAPKSHRFQNRRDFLNGEFAGANNFVTPVGDFELLSRLIRRAPISLSVERYPRCQFLGNATSVSLIGVLHGWSFHSDSENLEG